MTHTTELECVACGKTKRTDDAVDQFCECGGPMSRVSKMRQRLRLADKIREAHSPGTDAERASIAGGDPMPASQLTPPRMGWVCGKCQRSLAPHVEECPCSAKGWDKGGLALGNPENYKSKETSDG